ncbi:MAG TPA: radical SAM protein [Clostridia bacterium]
MRKILFWLPEDASIYSSAEVNYSAAYIKNKGFEVHRHSGIENLSEVLESVKPDFIAVTSDGCHCSNFEFPKEITVYKKRYPETKIIGGVGVPNGNSYFDSNYDCGVCSGSSPALVLEDVLKGGESKGLLTSKGKLPLDMTPLRKSTRWVMLRTSRGCCNNCSFCSVKLHNPGYECLEPEKVLDILQNYNDLYVTFADSSFEDPNTKRLKEILRGIIDRKLNIKWGCNFRPNFYRKLEKDIELQELLKTSGLKDVFIGVESADNEGLKIYNKHTTIEESTNLIQWLRSNGIYVNIGFIPFHPWTTLEGLRKNIDWLEKYNFVNVEAISRILGISDDNEKLKRKLRRDNLLNGKNIIFKDKKVEPLHHFMRGIADIPLFQEYDDTLNNIKTAWLDEKPYYEELEAIKKVTGKHIAIWYRELLKLVENGFDESKATDITMKILPANFIRNTIDMMKGLQEESKCSNIEAVTV